MNKSRETQDGAGPEDKVEVHVTFFGGLYVDPGKLLRSKAAQASIKRVGEVFGAQFPDVPESDKPHQSAD